MTAGNGQSQGASALKPPSPQAQASQSSVHCVESTDAGAKSSSSSDQDRRVATLQSKGKLQNTLSEAAVM